MPVVPTRRGAALRVLTGIVAVTLFGTLVAITAPRAEAATTSLVARVFDQRSPLRGEVIPRFTPEHFSSPAVGDILPNAGLEVAVGGADGWVHIFSASTGAPMVAYPITGRGLGANPAPPTFRSGQTLGMVTASPALADLNRDGLLDIVVGDMIGQVVGMTGTGQVLFYKHACFRFRAQPPIDCDTFSTPAIGDMNGDGRPEIAVASMDHHLHAWTFTGNPGVDLDPNFAAGALPGFPRFLFDSTWSSPTMADVNRDGMLDLVVGADMDRGGGDPFGANCCPASSAVGGGEVWAFAGNGAHLWHTDLPGEVIFSSPSVGDVNGDGVPDVVVGTGYVFHTSGFAGAAEAARRVHALDGRNGRPLPGWPVTLVGESMVSPALGQLDGDPGLEVVTLDDNGWVQAWDGARGANGGPQWMTCGAVGPCNRDWFAKGSPVIADVDSDGQQEVVTSVVNDLRVISGDSGAIEATVPAYRLNPGGRPTYFVSQSTPAVAQVDGEARIFQAVQFDADNNLVSDGGDAVALFAYGTGRPLGRADWPMFRQNPARTGTIVDRVAPAVDFRPPGSIGSNAVELGWWATDFDASGSQVARFEIYVRDATFGGGFALWLSVPPRFVAAPEASGSAVFHGLPGHTYVFVARAIDNAGNVGAFTPDRPLVVSGGAPAPRPRAAYGLANTGDLSAIRSPQVPGPLWSGDIARDIALRPDGSGYVLDLFGGMHPIGGAPALTGPYWPGWDIARGMALNPDGQGGYVLDGFGGLHPVGNAAPVAPGGYWRGQDIAREIVLLPFSTAQQPAGYVMDLYGGMHAFGSAPPAWGAAYWNGWAIARDVVANPAGPGGWTLDGFGGMHPFGGAPPLAGGGYWNGWDIARSLAIYNDNGVPRGWMLDGFGGIHPVNGAPAPDATRYWGVDVAREIIATRS